MRTLFTALIFAILASVASVAQARTATAIPPPIVQCGGDFASYVARMKQEALRRGHPQANVDAFFASVRYDQATINADRAQGIFNKGFVDFSRSLISQYRIDAGRSNLQKYRAVFDAVESRYGVSRGVLVAFWAFETDYGAFQGDFNTLNSLMTLGFDCRRPGLFQPQVFAALRLYEKGDFDPATTTGAWAGEIGMVQMLPGDILDSGVDGDGDGHVRLKSSAADALLSGANMLRKLGWRAGEPWIEEVILPQGFDYSKTGTHQKMRVGDWAAMGVQARDGQLASSGMSASVLVPQGYGGPAFIAYPNFDVYFEWNQSFTYVMTAAYFATRLEGAPVYNAGNPSPPLSGSQMRTLQQKLQARGHDVGAIDGILGAGTRLAVQKEQMRLGLIADSWPTLELLNRL